MERLRKSWLSSEIQLETITNISPRLVTILLLGMVVGIAIFRLSTIGIPALHWTVWKEIDYLAISQNFWKNGFNFLHPEVSWPAEPPRVTEMELPLVPFAAALLYQVFGYGPLTARMVTLFAWLLMMIYVYRLACREFTPYIGLLSALCAGILPLYHPFNRFLFTEPSMIAMSVVSVYYVAEWADTSSRRKWILSIISLSLTFSLKLESLYLLLPLFWIVFRKHRFNIARYRAFIFLIMLSLILPVVWYSYAYYLETTGAHLFGIFKGHNKSQFATLLLDFRWYRTMAGRIINGITGGFYGFGLFVLGLLFMFWNRKGSLIFAYLLSVVAYFGLIAEGQIDAPYRQLPIIPVVSIFIAFGAQTLVRILLAAFDFFKGSDVRGRTMTLAAASISFLFIVLIPIQRLGDVFVVDGPAYFDRWNLAQEIGKTASEESKLVVVGEYTKHVGGYDISPVLYYYAGLQGWNLTPDKWNAEYIETLRNKGATHLVFVKPYGYPSAFFLLPEVPVEPFIQEMRAKYRVLFDGQDQLVLDLR